MGEEGAVMDVIGVARVDVLVRVMELARGGPRAVARRSVRAIGIVQIVVPWCLHPSLNASSVVLVKSLVAVVVMSTIAETVKKAGVMTLIEIEAMNAGIVTMNTNGDAKLSDKA